MPTKISWADRTWNPITGCSKVSDGCKFCYAERLSLANQSTPKPWTRANEQANIILHDDRITLPFGWLKPSRIFTCSMADMFHERIPDSFLIKLFHTMNHSPRHTFMILTKRIERAANWPGPWPNNIWLGTSVEDSRVIDRIDTLRQSRAAIKFVSFEPLLGPVGQVNLSGIHWAIVGGESGPQYRPFDHAWARQIKTRAQIANCAFFFKQSAGLKSETGTELIEADGSRWVWHQFPNDHAAPYRADQPPPPPPVETQLSLF